MWGMKTSESVTTVSLSVLVLSVGVSDLLTTLYLFYYGSYESNIIMRIAFLRGPNIFASIKLLITTTVSATIYWFLSNNSERMRKYGLILSGWAIGFWGICVINNLRHIISIAKSQLFYHITSTFVGVSANLSLSNL